MSGGTRATERELIDAAIAARAHARCEYSGFAVGAALLESTGTIWTAANVENASYTLGLCAERVAIFYALTHGGSDFVRLAIATDALTPTPPCGACRQILWEFAPSLEIIAAGAGGVTQRWHAGELLPAAFGAASLERPR